MLNYPPAMAGIAHSYEELEGEALHLTLQERSRLASRLLESLDDGDDLSDEWLSEIRQRVKSLDDGSAKLIPHSEVMTRVRKRISEGR
ncbi:MAG: addiction module protein [Akkermansiaceae bacterium]